MTKLQILLILPWFVDLVVTERNAALQQRLVEINVCFFPTCVRGFSVPWSPVLGWLEESLAARQRARGRWAAEGLQDGFSPLRMGLPLLLRDPGRSTSA